jgi:hypothetical protein
MRLRSLLAGLAFAAAGFATPASASLADVSIHDRRDGRELPIHWFQGRRYVVGEPGREYEIRVRNFSGVRVLAVTSVDGVNVLSGETASAEQSGYVVDPNDQVRIDGWRKSLSEVAAFYFTRLPDSYAARTGRPGDVGVIGVALFREKAYVPSPTPAPDVEASRDRAAEPPSSMGTQRKSERLGTGHGERVESAAQRVEFERASEAPDDVISIWYDTRAHLIAQGVLPRPPKPSQRPDPFPAWDPGFVPNP